MRDWPLKVQLLARLRKPSDKGAGDTLARVFNLLPVYKGMGAGDAIKAFMAAISRECGCDDRRKKMNEWYPYER